MATRDDPQYSSSFLRTDSSLYFKFKDYKFFYCPKTVRFDASQRKGEYRYINTDGVEYTRLKDSTQINVEGLWIKTVEGEGFQATAVSQLQNLHRLDKDNTSGILHLPRFGDWEAILDGWRVEEDGDYPGDYNFVINFLVNTAVKQVTKIDPYYAVSQVDLAPEEQRYIIYTLKAEDSLSGVAAKYGVTLSQLKAWNPNLFNASHLNGKLTHAGEKVYIEKASAHTESPSINDSSATKEVLHVKSGVTEIPRDSRLASFVDNKGKPLSQKTPYTSSWASAPGNTTYSSYISPRTGSDIPKPAKIVTGVAIGDYYRKGDTTVQKYYKELKKIAALDNNSVAAAVESSADKAYKLWEVFGDLIEYPSDRGQKIDTAKAVDIANRALA